MNRINMKPVAWIFSLTFIFSFFTTILFYHTNINIRALDLILSNTTFEDCKTYHPNHYQFVYYTSLFFPFIALIFSIIILKTINNNEVLKKKIHYFFKLNLQK
jgi:hypothetical protein